MRRIIGVYPRGENGSAPRRDLLLVLRVLDSFLIQKQPYFARFSYSRSAESLLVR